MDREKLGIPSNYSCVLETTGGGIGGNRQIVIFDCIDDPTGAENIYSTTRKIVVFQENDDSTVDKAQLQRCIDAVSCQLTEGTITLKVWKP